MFQVPVPIIYIPQKLYPNNDLSKISNESNKDLENVYFLLFMLLIFILVKKMKN